MRSQILIISGAPRRDAGAQTPEVPEKNFFGRPRRGTSPAKKIFFRVVFVAARAPAPPPAREDWGGGPSLLWQPMRGAGASPLGFRVFSSADQD